MAIVMENNNSIRPIIRWAAQNTFARSVGIVRVENITACTGESLSLPKIALSATILLIHSKKIADIVDKKLNFQ